jgi:dipeptidyl aminopeptidase/acylaminoacyl peptidase
MVGSSQPAWRPELAGAGSVGEIAFVRNGALDVVRSNGTGLRQLVSVGPGAGGVWQTLMWPAWSPNGASIVFSAILYGGDGWRQEIDRVAASGGGPVLLHAEPTGAYDNSPSYSPDGSAIAFTRWTDTEGGSVWIMNADGSGAHQIARLPGFATGLAWGPDGRLAVTLVAWERGVQVTQRDVEAVNGLYLMRSDGSGLRRIAPQAVTRPAWLPDGRVLFTLSFPYANEVDLYTTCADCAPYTLYARNAGYEPAVRVTR